MFHFSIPPLYHPNRHDQIISIKRAELLCHAENGACADLQGGFVDHAEGANDAFIGHCGLLDLQRTQFAVALHNDIDLLRVLVAVEIEIRLKSRILIALHDLGHRKVLKQCAAHSATLGNLGA